MDKLSQQREYVTGWRIDTEVLPLLWRQVDFAAGEVRIDDLRKRVDGMKLPQAGACRAARPVAVYRTAPKLRRTLSVITPI